MGLREFVRGTVAWESLEAVAREVVRRNDEAAFLGADGGVVRVEFLEADNWLSTPFVVADRWFVKVVSPQNALVHAVFTGARNLGAVSTGTEGFFQRFDGPVEMAEHELAATRRMRELGIDAPEPVEAFEVDGLGVLVLEYLPAFRTLDELSDEEVAALAGELFASLAVMHGDELVHGDLRGENVLVYEGDLYFIDATNVREGRIDDARSYDLACALAALERYSTADLLAAREFLDFVAVRPDHDFESATVKGEIEKAAS